MIRAAVVGYGNLGKAAETALTSDNGFKYVGAFTSRNAKTVNSISGAPIYDERELTGFLDKIDVLLLCGGSARDLPERAAGYLKLFNTVDCFDTHSKIARYRENMQRVAEKYNKVCIYSAGWDPGLFSVYRLLFDCAIKNGKTYTFWGKGVSQGHSNAIKTVKGVKYASVYTVPDEAAKKAVCGGQTPCLTKSEMHSRECFVVKENGADENIIKAEIKGLKDYFSDCDVKIYFISEEEFLINHATLYHGGEVIRTGTTAGGSAVTLKSSLKAQSNAELTAAIAVACARAVYALKERNKAGAFNLLDIPLKFLSDKSEKELINLL